MKSPLAIKQPHKQRKATSIKGPSESSVGFVEEVGTPVFYHPSEDEHPVFDAIDQSTSTEYRSFSPSNLPKVSTGAATAYKPIVEKLEQKEVLLREEKMKDKLGSTSSLSTKSAKTTSKFPYGWNGREFYAEILGTFILMVLNNGIVATYVLRKKGPIDVLAQAYVAGQYLLTCSFSLYHTHSRDKTRLIRDSVLRGSFYELKIRNGSVLVFAWSLIIFRMKETCFLLIHPKQNP